MIVTVTVFTPASFEVTVAVVFPLASVGAGVVTVLVPVTLTAAAAPAIGFPLTSRAVT